MTRKKTPSYNIDSFTVASNVMDKIITVTVDNYFNNDSLKAYKEARKSIKKRQKPLIAKSVAE